MRKNDYFQRLRTRTAAIMGLVILLLFVCSIMGTRRIDRYVGHSMEESAEAMRQASEAESRAESAAASIEASKVEETAVHEMEISQLESRILSQLKEKLDGGDFSGAAKVLEENQRVFQQLYFDRLEQGGWIYDGERVTDFVEGHGMVLIKASTVFYGTFRNGTPDGECVALQAAVLEEGKRYDYSKGNWHAGVMSGQGECGYDYYEGVTDDNTKTVVKKGQFEADLMEGQLQYFSTNKEGMTTSWTMEAAAGVIVPDDRWKRTEEADGITYQLMSDQDDAHVYSIEEEDMKQVRWRNMIEW